MTTFEKLLHMFDHFQSLLSAQTETSYMSPKCVCVRFQIHSDRNTKEVKDIVL